MLRARFCFGLLLTQTKNWQNYIAKLPRFLKLWGYGARRAPTATGLKEGGAVTPRVHSLVPGPIGGRGRRDPLLDAGKDAGLLVLGHLKNHLVGQPVLRLGSPARIESIG